MVRETLKLLSSEKPPEPLRSVLESLSKGRAVRSYVESLMLTGSATIVTSLTSSSADPQETELQLQTRFVPASHIWKES
jgi:hypothetical protein